MKLHSDECPMCLSCAECLDHVLVNCSTAKVVGAHIKSWVDWWPWHESTAEGIWVSLNATGGDNAHKMVRKVIGAAFFWSIWSQRNNKVFKGCCKKETEIFRDTQFLAFDWIRVVLKAISYLVGTIGSVTRLMPFLLVLL